ncbi:CPBP family intramembrane metalloprotease [Bacillus shivajii]|uniref:CPBP family intramembrane glutamic endopeptidase n=1 Tax=Bacillus shivajii TaxID=1983719 RepID=UPI001CFC1A3A|nr:type II CAAX endopeptidase family protein [Bacillus shivajii]UCZ53711.1 CPBP family intramembrane metalloprotease [Bacillus shivajii]
MTKRYWLILIAFVVMQLATSLVTIPILLSTGFSGSTEELFGMALLITFSIGFVVIVYLTVTSRPDEHFMRDKADISTTILWSILGIFMAFAAQYVAALIEMLVLDIEPGSENTQQIVDMANAVPWLMIVVAVLVPVMEEIVFRMVIFGSLYKRFGFWISALLSGFIFAIVHWDFEHLLVYLAMGVVFAYLYWKTKRIIVPIIAHVGINSFVMLIQVVFGEQIQRIVDQYEQMQMIIGGLF